MLHLAIQLLLTTTSVATLPGQWSPTPAEWKYPVWPSGCDRFEGAERGACLAFVAADFGRMSRYASANALLAAPGAPRVQAVFFGDSITDNWSAPGFGGFFPGRAYVNRGISGQSTNQMVVRFRADVIALRPRAVVILAGTNDLSGNAGPQSLEETEGHLATMAELARAHGLAVVLASLLPVRDGKPGRDGQPLVQTAARPPEKIAALNRWLEGYARRNGHAYLDYFSATADGEGRFKAELTDDGLHPNAAGYAVMAPLAEKAIAQALARRR